MTELFKCIPTEAYLILAVSLSGFILLLGFRIAKKGFDLKWGKNKEFNCVTERIERRPDGTEIREEVQCEMHDNTSNKEQELA